MFTRKAMHNSTERSTAAAALAGLFYSSDSTAAHNRRDETKTQGPGPKKPPRAKKPNGCASRIHSSRLHPLDAPTPVHWTHPRATLTPHPCTPRPTPRTAPPPTHSTPTPHTYRAHCLSHALPSCRRADLLFCKGQRPRLPPLRNTERERLLGQQWKALSQVRASM